MYIKLFLRNKHFTLFDRFTSDEKAKRDPFTYLPFGLGPRQCIGVRLAMLELKMAAAKVIQQFKLNPTKVGVNLIHNFNILIVIYRLSFMSQECTR